MERSSSAASSREGWRSRPGFLLPGCAERSSVRVLLGRFLSDRTSPNPLPGRSLFSNEGRFQWGAAPPLEKIVHSRADLDALALRPLHLQNAVTIIEPWEHVGYTAAGEPLRASTNVAYVLQKIAAAGLDPAPDVEQRLARSRSPRTAAHQRRRGHLRGRCSVGLRRVELPGHRVHARRPLRARGSPAARAPALFGPDDLHLSRPPAGGGLSGAARAAGRRGRARPRRDPGRRERRRAECTPGCLCPDSRDQRKLEVHKGDGVVVAQGWNDPCFAVAPNESPERGTRVLTPYRPRVPAPARCRRS